jgi:hypothetical protein
LYSTLQILDQVDQLLPLPYYKQYTLVFCFSPSLLLCSFHHLVYY